MWHNRTAAIFDLDGTLLDSMGVWDQIDVEFLARRGLDVPADYVEAIGHLPFPQVAEYTIRRFGLSHTPGEIMEEWNDMALRHYRHHIPLKPGSREYLESVRDAGIQLAVATSLSDPLREAAFAQHGLDGFFPVICTTDQVPRGKEHPDIYLLTAEQLRVPPSQCVVFEDLLPAVRSAKGVGMAVVAILDDASRTFWEEIRREADGAYPDFQKIPLPGKIPEKSKKDSQKQSIF